MLLDRTFELADVDNIAPSVPDPKEGTLKRKQRVLSTVSDVMDMSPTIAIVQESHNRVIRLR